MTDSEMTRRRFFRRVLTFILQAVLVLGLGMIAGALWRMNRDANRGAVATDTTAVRVITVREGDAVRFIVENQELSEVTMTFDFHVVNMKSEVEFPYTATFLPGRTEAFTLTPEEGQTRWEYAYTNYYKLGSSVAIPDSYLYHLPYAPGRTYKVTQAFNGRFSHSGANQYAIDWKMPEGTPVHAARDGLVVKVKDDSNQGGNGMEYDKYNNYVLIRHDDGTLGHYCHLQQGGARVKPGDRVVAGQVIALSGNTGYSSGAHLHFCVFRTRNGRERVSVPIRFRGENGEELILQAGHRYRAPDIESARIELTAAGGAELE